MKGDAVPSSVLLLGELVEPFVSAREAWLILVHVIEVDSSVRPIAPGAARVLVELAATQRDSLLLTSPLELKRFEVTPSLDVRHVTEGLSLRLSARAPHVLLARHKFDLVRCSLGDHGQIAWVQMAALPNPRSQLDF